MDKKQLTSSIEQIAAAEQHLELVISTMTEADSHDDALKDAHAAAHSLAKLRRELYASASVLADVDATEHYEKSEGIVPEYVPMQLSVDRGAVKSPKKSS
jgi:hypothetical protein